MYIFNILEYRTFLAFLSLFMNTWFTLNYSKNPFNDTTAEMFLNFKFNESYLFFSILILLSILVIDKIYFALNDEYLIWEFWLCLGSFLMCYNLVWNSHLNFFVNSCLQYLSFKLGLIYVTYALLQWLVEAINFRFYQN